MKQKKSIKKIETSSLLKGYQINIEKYQILEETSSFIHCPPQININWYSSMLKTKGLLSQGRFQKDHSEYKSSSPIVGRMRAANKPTSGYTCDQCQKYYKTERGLNKHKLTVHAFIE